MRILDKDGNELDEASLDYDAGYLAPDSVVSEHHGAVEFQPERGHAEPWRVHLSDGSVVEVGADDPRVSNVTDTDFDFAPDDPSLVVTGKEMRWVVDSPQVDAAEAWDEWEPIQRWVEWTPEQIAERAAQARAEARAEASVALASMLAASLPDEQAARVPVLYDPWSGKGVDYAEGDRREHDGALYKCLLDHTSQAGWEPPAAPSLWARVLPGQSGEVGPWEQPESTEGYSTGDQVTHAGRLWESKQDDNIWEPGATGSPWRDLGPWTE